MKLWKQSLVADIQIYLTKLGSSDLYLELAIKERFKTYRFFKFQELKGDQTTGRKSWSFKRQGAYRKYEVECSRSHQKFYNDKGYRNVVVDGWTNSFWIKQRHPAHLHIKRELRWGSIPSILRVTRSCLTWSWKADEEHERDEPHDPFPGKDRKPLRRFQQRLYTETVFQRLRIPV